MHPSVCLYYYRSIVFIHVRRVRLLAMAMGAPAVNWMVFWADVSAVVSVSMAWYAMTSVWYVHR